MTTGATLLTAEEYALLPNDNDRFTELVRGEVVSSPLSTVRHGQICSEIAYWHYCFLEDHDVGHIATNGSGVITRRNPDTVRGPDIIFLGYANYPKGPLPQSYAEIPPEVVFEVRSPSDGWTELDEKVAEYLAAGVVAVCVVDDQGWAVHVYRAGDDVTLTGDEELTLPEIHADLRIAVSRFFDSDE